jgi:hypothetical protein
MRHQHTNAREREWDQTDAIMILPCDQKTLAEWSIPTSIECTSPRWVDWRTGALILSTTSADYPLDTLRQRSHVASSQSYEPNHTAPLRTQRRIQGPHSSSYLQ